MAESIDVDRLDDNLKLFMEISGNLFFARLFRCLLLDADRDYFTNFSN